MFRKTLTVLLVVGFFGLSAFAFAEITEKLSNADTEDCSSFMTLEHVYVENKDGVQTHFQIPKGYLFNYTKPFDRPNQNLVFLQVKADGTAVQCPHNSNVNDIVVTLQAGMKDGYQRLLNNYLERIYTKSAGTNENGFKRFQVQTQEGTAERDSKNELLLLPDNYLFKPAFMVCRNPASKANVRGSCKLKRQFNDTLFVEYQLDVSALSDLKVIDENISGFVNQLVKNPKSGE